MDVARVVAKKELSHDGLSLTFGKLRDEAPALAQEKE